MADTTYQELIHKFDYTSNKLSYICNTIALPISYIRLVYKVIDLWYTGTIALRIINKVERINCIKCDGSCGFPQKEGLDRIVKSMRHCINNTSDKPVPIVTPVMQNLLEQFEDKLENYWIATDKETKDLLHSLANSISQKNAH